MMWLCPMAASCQLRGFPCRLEEDPQDWVSPLHQSGFLREVIWEEDGEMIDLGSRPSVWSPPEPDSPTHRCCS